MLKLNINEIFASINGEVNRWGQGSPTVFVRLQGCNLRCDYCDTGYAQSTGDYDPMTMKDLITEIDSFGIKRVTITGGEPLIQENVYELIKRLSIKDYQISIETNGSIPLYLDWMNWSNLCWIVDYKEDFADQMIWSNYLKLVKTDYIKFVIRDYKSLLKAIGIKETMQKDGCLAQFAFSPVGADFNLAGKIAQWLIKHQIDDILLNLQIHKIISVR